MTDRAIRPAEPDDVKGIQRIARVSWHAAYDDIIGADTVTETIDEWYDVQDLRQHTVQDDHEFYVADADGILGFAHVAPHGNGVFQLLRIYAHPDEWGSGLGTRLLNRVEERLRERDGERLRLHVLADNEIGVSFYESRGFDRVDEQDASGFGVREYVYEKDL